MEVLKNNEKYKTFKQIREKHYPKVKIITRVSGVKVIEFTKI